MFTILVVDDDADVVESVSTLLELRFGRCARIVTARDGAQALAMAVAANPDLIVTDYAMPIMDGAALVRGARRVPALRDVPILILSGEPALAELTRDLDVQAVLRKGDIMELPNVARRFLPTQCRQVA